MKRFTVEEAIRGEEPDEARYEIWDHGTKDLVAFFYFKWFLKSHVLKICRELEKRIKTGKGDGR